jgi:hypothetical protein
MLQLSLQKRYTGQSREPGLGSALGAALDIFSEFFYFFRFF